MIETTTTKGKRKPIYHSNWIEEIYFNSEGAGEEAW